MDFKLIAVFLCLVLSQANAQKGKTIKTGRFQSPTRIKPIIQQQEALPAEQPLQQIQQQTFVAPAPLPPPLPAPVQQPLPLPQQPIQQQQQQQIEEGSLSPEFTGDNNNLPFIAPPPAPAPEPVGAGPDLDALWGPPQPYSFGYDSQGTSRQESSDGRKVTGSYTLVGADGINRVVHYVADGDGFRASIITNEPGTETQNPSGVIMHTSQPKAEDIARQYGPQKSEANILAVPIVPMPGAYRPPVQAFTPIAPVAPVAPIAIQNPAAASFLSRPLNPEPLPLPAQPIRPVIQEGSLSPEFQQQQQQHHQHHQQQQIQQQSQELENIPQQQVAAEIFRVPEPAPLPAIKAPTYQQPLPLAPLPPIKSVPLPSAPIKTPVRIAVREPVKGNSFFRQTPVKTFQQQQTFSAPRLPLAQVNYAAAPAAPINTFSKTNPAPVKGGKTSGRKRVLRPFVLRSQPAQQQQIFITTQAPLPIEQFRQTEAPQIFEQTQQASLSEQFQQQAHQDKLDARQEAQEQPLNDQNDQFF
ncbi:uncharacterized protein LOC141855000 [Brevipalpus obovatus]|uniref:uncharacterized protein LOC141855000 n=1 Tax=Brevipalpus obovatus TaxID=246614 RepID=UPI003D9E4F02